MKRISLDELPVQGVSHNPAIGKRVMLDESAIPGLTNFSQAVLSQDQVAPGHAHPDMYEVFFVRRGTGMIVVDGTEYELATGQCMLIDPGEYHEVRNPGAGELELLYFGVRGAPREVQP
jgi:quercetin dioxygenase-like cupin family protein